MPRKLIKILSFLLCFCLIFEQSGFAQIAGQLDLSGYIGGILRNSFTQDKFRPLHLRYLSYDNQANTFKLLLDKGDAFKPNPSNSITQATKELMEYFFIGVTLPNDAFWVNLRPDAEDNVVDPFLAQTDIGKILLEADVQLKKDTAKATSPQTPEGKKYWDKLYQKAEELFGYDNITIPTLTRPWIVPGEIIIREAQSNAYIYKATLKVMLEQDYLKDSATYNFNDPRLKALNEYSSELIRELIIPKLTKEINTSKRYAALRQVYYSLILAQWFKARFRQSSSLRGASKASDEAITKLIDSKKLTNFTSKTFWSKTTYFQEYQQSFKGGEYNIQEPRHTPFGQTIRSYFSGGMNLSLKIPEPGASSPVVTSIISKRPLAPNKGIGVEYNGGNIIIASSPAADASQAPVFLKHEEHQEFYYRLKELVEGGKLKKGLPLVVFDYHNDYGREAHSMSPEDLSEVNWIGLCVKEGLVEEVYWVRPKHGYSDTTGYLDGYTIITDDVSKILEKLSGRECVVSFDSDYFVTRTTLGATERNPAEVELKSEMQGILSSLFEGPKPVVVGLSKSAIYAYGKRFPEILSVFEQGIEPYRRPSPATKASQAPSEPLASSPVTDHRARNGWAVLRAILLSGVLLFGANQEFLSQGENALASTARTKQAIVQKISLRNYISILHKNQIKVTLISDPKQWRKLLISQKANKFTTGITVLTFDGKIEIYMYNGVDATISPLEVAAHECTHAQHMRLGEVGSLGRSKLEGEMADFEKTLRNKEALGLYDRVINLLSHRYSDIGQIINEVLNYKLSKAEAEKIILGEFPEQRYLFYHKLYEPKIKTGIHWDGGFEVELPVEDLERILNIPNTKPLPAMLFDMSAVDLKRLLEGMENSPDGVSSEFFAFYYGRLVIGVEERDRTRPLRNSSLGKEVITMVDRLIEINSSNFSAREFMKGHCRRYELPLPRELIEVKLQLAKPAKSTTTPGSSSVKLTEASQAPSGPLREASSPARLDESGVERAKRILLDRSRRPEPSEVAMLDDKDIQVAAREVFGIDDIKPILDSEAIMEARNVLPYVYKITTEILRRKPDKVLVVGRDAEVLYDALKTLTAGTIDEEKIILFPGSMSCVQRLFMLSDTRPELAREFLGRYGITAQAIRSGRKIMLVDSGNLGTVGAYICETAIKLFGEEGITSQSVHNCIDVELISMDSGHFEFANQLISFDLDIGKLQHEFPRVYRFLDHARRPTSPYDRPLELQWDMVNGFLGRVLQVMPRYHGRYNLKDDEGHLVVVPDNAEYEYPGNNLNIIVDINPIMIYPVAAMIVQRMAVKYFTEKKKDLKQRPNQSGAGANESLRGAQGEVITSSPVSDKGGIDFRGLPIVTQPLPNPQLTNSNLSLNLNLNLEKEWREIEKMLKAGITPSTERIREYALSACQQQSADAEIGRILSCIADILRLEEEGCYSTEPALRELLALLESGSPIEDFGPGLAKIQALPKEPKIRP